MNIMNTSLNFLSLIDGARLANSLAIHYSHKGNQFIEGLLRKKNLSEQAIHSALSQLENEVERAWKEVNKRLAGNLDSSEETLTIVRRFLRGRQFSYLTTSKVIAKLSNAEIRQRAA